MLEIQNTECWGAYLSPTSIYLVEPCSSERQSRYMTCPGEAQGLDLNMDNVGSETLALTFET